MSYKKCRICGTEYDGIVLATECPVCNWVQSYDDSKDDDYDEANHMTASEAKNNYEKGLNIWGEPLPKK
jgi:hypothetical protein